MIALTPKQIEQLDALIAVEAFEVASSAGPFDGLSMFNNMVLGKLQSMGFADSKVIRSGAMRGNGRRAHGQQTVYWITAEGRARAAAR